MMRVALTVAVLALGIGLAEEALAHGGSYRQPPGYRQRIPGGPPGPRAVTPPGQPGPTPATPRPLSGPGAGGGLHRPPPLPKEDVLDWQRWWLYNRDRFLQVRRVLSRRRTTTDSEAPEADWRGEAVRALLEALDDDHVDVATGSALALGKTGDPRAVEPLIEVLKDRKARQTVREAAALGLGMLTADEGRTALVDLLLDRREPERLRAFAAFGLGIHRSPSALPALVTVVRDRQAPRSARAAALVALGHLGDDIVLPVLLDAVKGKIAGITDLERACALDGLGRLGDPAAIPILLKGLAVKDRWLRQASVLALGRIEETEGNRARDALRHLSLHEENRMVRTLATIALGRTGRPEAAVPLLQLGDSARYVNQKGLAILAAAIAARTGGDDAVIERVASSYRSRLASGKISHDLRGAAAVSLGILKDRKAVPVLEKILGKRGDPEMRGHVAVALGMIGDREAVPALRAALDAKGDPRLLREVALALGLLGDSESLRDLERLVRRGKTEWIRANASLGLARIGGPIAARAMIDLLADERGSGPSRGMAAVALGHLLDERPLPALAELIEDLDFTLPIEAIQELLTIL
jgi:HEAT repeat protein